MKIFQQMEVEQAVDYAGAGRQALHLHRIIVDWIKAPYCFRKAIENDEDIAHLFDRDASRLEATARALGVKVILIERPGGRGQHIDLCGGPLRKAVAMARRLERRANEACGLLFD